jgi:hypothetical protein
MDELSFADLAMKVVVAMPLFSDDATLFGIDHGSQ